MKQANSIYRLRHKHAPPATAAIDVPALLAEQSLRRATLGALAAAAILTAMWVYAVMLFDQFFPWGSVILGFFVGRAAQHFGRGIDWRFAALAAGVAVTGAFIGSFVAALFLTGREFGMNPLPLLTEVSWHTLRTFAGREFGFVGSVYALTAAALAAFFAQRRLSAAEAVALIKYRQETE